ncbi:MAG: EF-P lysine aminoacylase GenX [Polyangiaceae bacterium]|nr:EF-P lysine aminoacylase GenX [Polyangiaceae bacterium]
MAEPPVRVLSPADLAATAGRVRVGGRVVVAGDGRVRIADALGTVDVELEVDLAPGSLVIVEGTASTEGLQDAELLWQQRCPEPRGDDDPGRFLFGGVGDALRARSRVLQGLRDYFAEQDFLEIDAPQLLETPALDVHVDAVSADEGWLSTSPEFQLKRLLSGGLPRIYSLGHVFRGDPTGVDHEREFMLLEWYRAFDTVAAVQRDTELLVERVLSLLGACPVLTRADGRRVDVRPPYERTSVRELFRRYAGVDDAVDLAASDEARYFELWVERVEPGLEGRDTPVFVERFPARHASLAARDSDDPSVAARFELYLAGKELCNGFQELTCPLEQRARFERDRQERARAGKAVHAIDERLLSALAAGMPPAAGNALGVDRLLALGLGRSAIQSVMAFPRAGL